MGRTHVRIVIGLAVVVPRRPTHKMKWQELHRAPVRKKNARPRFFLLQQVDESGKVPLQDPRSGTLDRR